MNVLFFTNLNFIFKKKKNGMKSDAAHIKLLYYDRESAVNGVHINKLSTETRLFRCVCVIPYRKMR